MKPLEFEYRHYDDPAESVIEVRQDIRDTHCDRVSTRAQEGTPEAEDLARFVFQDIAHSTILPQCIMTEYSGEQTSLCVQQPAGAGRVIAKQGITCNSQ